MRSTKLTSKCQATIPKEVRDSLRLKAGDTIVFELLPHGEVRIRKLKPLDIASIQSFEKSFSKEWNSPEDDEAYAHLQKI